MMASQVLERRCAVALPRSALLLERPISLTAASRLSTQRSTPAPPSSAFSTHSVRRLGSSSAEKESTMSTSFASIREADAAGQRYSHPFSSRNVVGAFILFSAFAVAYSSWLYYTSFMTWPAELRHDLREAIQAGRAKDYDRMISRFERALLTARTLSAEKLGDNALLKVSGIAIALGAAQEGGMELNKAFETYAHELDIVKEHAKTPQERLRAVALAQKCGDLRQIKEVDEAHALDTEYAYPSAEEYLSWSVEELLRLAVPDETRQAVLEGKQDAISLSDLNLPSWVSAATLGASLEALGQRYAAQGNASYAVPLYMQAISLLMPPKGDANRAHEPTVADRCRCGILMNNVAQLMVDADEHKGKPAKVDDAQAWAMRGLDIVTFALRGTGWDGKGGQGFKTVEVSSDDRTAQVQRECFAAHTALLINLAELARMKHDDCRARELFQQAYVHADKYGMREARQRCAQALAELERAGNRRKK